MKVLQLVLVVLTLASCGIGPFQEPPTQVEKDRFAKSHLDSIQAASIAEQKEYCGYFYYSWLGQMRATAPRKGEFATCSMPVPPAYARAFANYHTHGAYGEDYDNEVPSLADMETVFDLRRDGYLTTPGGRFWRLNYNSRDALQLCGLGCVTSDPNFVRRNESRVRPRYSILQLALRNGV